jgi:hypothetical protein
MEIDFKLIDNVVVDGIDYNDYPDFCDAFIAEADYDGKPMSQEMIDDLNENYTDFVLESVYSQVF